MQRRWSQLTLFLILPFASLFLTASAQTNFDPNTVPLSTRNLWCQGNLQACTLVCGSTSLNTCNSNDLSYECICSDGTAADLAQYALTLPYFICQEATSQCLANNAGNPEGQVECNARQCANNTPGVDFGGVPTSTPSTTSSAGSPTPDPEPTSEVQSQDIGEITSSNPPEIPSTPTGQATVSERTTTTSSSTSSSTSGSPNAPSRTDRSSTTGTNDPSATSNGPSGERTGAGDSADGGGGKKGLSTGAIIGIAVGVGVPALLILLFLAYRWGGRQAKDPPTLAPAFVNKQPQWQGGNEIAGGGGYPGVGHGNEVGGIEGNYGVSNQRGFGGQY
ncbi:hypothetical protein TWF506_009179 [Arthrobotrys conoides]|uniref:DUF7707 domain-containing protein n=1 Tax=Arthrobotrys conoides TaxID=74498 RepID=A0AAN8NM58_9PEZI